MYNVKGETPSRSSVTILNIRHFRRDLFLEMEERSDQTDADIEHHFTVLVRLPFKRGDFIDPPPVAWSAAKERELWHIISRPSKGNAIDWKSLADQFQVSQQFLLQQAAWLYERQLSQVRAQMRRVGTNQSNPPSPLPGSMSGSNLGAQVPRRTGSGSSRVPSGLSNRQRESPVPTTDAEATRSSRLRSIGGARNLSTNTVSDFRKNKGAQHSPLPASKDQTSIMSQQSVDRPLSPASPPLQESSSEQSTSEEDNDTDRNLKSRRHQPPPLHRRGNQPRPQSFIQTSQSEDGDEDDDGGSDSAPFLPFAAAALPKSQSSKTRGQDPGATLRGDLHGSNRPTTIRRATSERLPPTTQRPQQVLTPTHPPSDQHGAAHRQPLSTIDSSATSSSSSNNNAAPRPFNASVSQNATPQRQRQSSATALSPRQTAALNAAGITSPRIHRRANAGGGNASDGTGTPSMGSSFSDLDDTSVTQSALEEALASNMQRQGGGTGGQGQSRMSTISQALRSRYL